MKKGLYSLVYTIPALWLILLLFSCGYSNSSQTQRVDSLNYQSYLYHYKNLDSCQAYATQAYSQGNGYANGRAEALNNLAFHAFMKMDFEQSRKYLARVYEESNNELERLIADIGMMKICQRTSANKEFYDHRNSALQRIKRINEEQSAFNERELKRLTYALSEFHIISSIYYYYLQQEEQALEEINRIDPTAEIKKDTAQLLYYYYMKGSGGLCEGRNAEEIAIREFDYLGNCIVLSDEKGYLYFEANCLQAFAELLLNKQAREALRERRSGALKLINPEGLPDSVFILSMAQEALNKFKQYGDVYQIAGAYRTIASCLIQRQDYQAAVDTLQRALDYVNAHHEKYYECTDSTHKLCTFRANDTISLEKQWLTNERIQTVPEWIARLREQLSLAYSGLGMKVESDYNRNIYLDILDVTRQDKELESRYELLEKESQQLNTWLLAIISILLLTAILFWSLNKKWKKNNAEQIENLKQTLEICRKITASIPVDAADMEEITERIKQAIHEDINRLFGPCEIEIDIEQKKLLLQTSRKLNKDKQAILKVLSPYIAWAIENGSAFVLLGDERKEIEKERYIYEQHIADNKRQNIVKKACFAIVTGITPYLDRIINEVHKLKSFNYLEKPEIKEEKYQYIGELIHKINEYNDILALWIKMKQGTLSLNIENFALNDLFEILNKGRKTFESKQLHFTIEPTQAIVKADKALTLFMINTLTENARKYTPRNGSIKVYAEETDSYVEISVQDTGIGLSEEDRNRILGEKVYDSSLIGIRDEENRETLNKNKGSGFGLINCKGIIEKYRKTNALFQVCLFNIESEKGKGSRFYFRLPKGVRKIVSLLLLLLLPLGSLHAHDIPYYDETLERAAQFADSAYYSNIDGHYEQTIHFVDSAIVYLNEHHQKHKKQPAQLMVRSGSGQAAEITWWQQMFDTDYHVILDIRNEAAVASLALRNWDDYRYNNIAYTRLYKLLSEDSSLESYCKEMQHSSNNKTISIILCLFIAVVLAVGYYLLYFRRRILYRFNLEQVLEINKEIIASSMRPMQENMDIRSIPKQILQDTFDSINDLLNIQALGLAIYNEETQSLHYTSFPSVPNKEELYGKMKKCYEKQQTLYSEQTGIQCFPLYTELRDEKQYWGALALVRNHAGYQEDEILLAELITRYVSIIIMNVVIRMGDKYRDIELAQDDRLRAKHEENQLHVQNQVLDNCLSTIKHETLYYPNKIRQIIETLLQGVPEMKEKELVDNMEELIGYYKDIFTLLSSCAARQLEDITFRRNNVAVQELIDYAQKCITRYNKKQKLDLTLQTEPCALQVIGDGTLLKYLLENLIGAAFERQEKGELKLSARSENGFIRFDFTDTRGHYTQEELNQLFYPDMKRMQQNSDGNLKGTEYLICKQIIRDHDEYTGFRGCRINAEALQKGGITIWFTIPQKQL